MKTRYCQVRVTWLRHLLHSTTCK